jgi:hypothetical protein
LTDAERAEILAAIKDKKFRDFVFALQQTGCRPSEDARLTAADVRLDLGVWVLDRHKAAKKTGKPRVVYLNEIMLELSRSLVAMRPDARYSRASSSAGLSGVMLSGPDSGGCGRNYRTSSTSSATTSATRTRQTPSSTACPRRRWPNCCDTTRSEWSNSITGTWARRWTQCEERPSGRRKAVARTANGPRQCDTNFGVSDVDVTDTSRTFCLSPSSAASCIQIWRKTIRTFRSGWTT